MSGTGSHAMEWDFSREALSYFPRAEGLEWLEANGVGGWAASTVSGTHARRYHGLLVAATTPPTGRLVLLSSLDETLVLGERRIELAAHRFPGAIHPEGYRRITRFTRGLFPVWEYELPGARLRRTVAAIHGQNTTIVRYELIEGDSSWKLELRPFFAGRDYHSLARVNDSIERRARFADGVLGYRAYEGQPETFVAVPGAAWHAGPDWWRDFEYARERDRGLDFREDLFTPGTLESALVPGGDLFVVASTQDPSRVDACGAFEAELERRRALLAPFETAAPVCGALALAADAFVVRRGEDLRTVVAGYPWFTDWGRDTMIALPGLCLARGDHDGARRILEAFARAVDGGMLPNRFPDAGDEPEYNTVDATLWFFVAVHRYLQATGDSAFVRDDLLPVLREIVAAHRRGTRYGIGEDRDGLLRAGEPGVQLTWMDAKVGDWVVTPRHGKPVEVNALWYNALRILGALERTLGDAHASAQWVALARRVKRAFGAAFWNPSTGCLYDCVDGEQRDASVRPNQIFALSLPFPLLAGERARSVLDTVTRELLTPYGLRSLARGDDRYVPRYVGGVRERDGSYHQGTVWSWLLGPYLTALVRVKGTGYRSAARRLLKGIERHLGEACVGNVSEIFDGDPPHEARGCPAQAWSVAEILRAAIDDLGLGRTERPVARRGRARRPRAAARP